MQSRMCNDLTILLATMLSVSMFVYLNHLDNYLKFKYITCYQNIRQLYTFTSVLLFIHLFNSLFNCSMPKEVMFSVALVCLLPVCWQHYSKSYEQLALKCYGGVQAWGGKRNKLLDFNSNLDHHAD